MSLHIVQSIQDPLISLIKDDPVRPEISAGFRVSSWGQIFVLQDDITCEPSSVICCAYRSQVPENVEELLVVPSESSNPKVAVFYTIWSYRPGAGRRLILQVRDWILKNRQQVNQFVTLSPPTEMARIFHLRNGAEIFRINSDTVNYLYP